MADPKRITVKIGVDLSEFKKGMQDIQKGLRRAFGRDTLKLSENMARSFVAIRAAFVFAGAASVKMSGDFSMTRKAFESMLGSADKAKEFLDDLAQFAAKTPFEFTGLTQASKKLLAYGFTAEQVIPLLTTIGDASSAVGLGQEGINRVTLALGQMNAKGKVTAQEMRQLAETGLPVWDILAKKLGVTVPEAMKMSEKGAISASVGIEAIVKGLNDRFGGMMDKMAGELPQLFSNMKDTLEITMIDIGDRLVETFNLKEVFGNMADALSKFSSTLKTSGFAAALDTLIDPKLQAAIWAISAAITAGMLPALASMAAGAAAALLPLLPWLAIGAAIGAIAYVIIRNWEPIKKFFGNLWITMKLQGREAIIAIGRAFVWLADKFIKAGEKMFGWVPGIKDKLEVARQKIDEISQNLDDSSAEAQQKWVEETDAWNKSLEITEKLTTKIKKNLPKAEDFKMGKQGIEELDTTMKAFETSVRSFGTGMSNTMTDILMGTKRASEALMDLGKQLVKLLLDLAIKKALLGLFPGLGAGGNTPAGATTAKVPMLATGGVVTAPTLAILGERGDEAIVPLDRAGGGFGGPMKIENNLINNTGQPMTSETTAANDGETLIINTVLNAIGNNKGGIKTVIKQAAK